MITKLATLLAAASSVALLAEAFSSSFSRQGCLNPSASTNANFERTILWAAAEGKKKRRRRKQPPGGPASTELESPQISLPSEEIFDDDEEDEEEEIDIDLIKDVAMFKFDGEISTPGMSSGEGDVYSNVDHISYFEDSRFSSHFYS